MASAATAAVLSDSPAKIPPVWNQRAPSEPKISPQGNSPGCNWLVALLARSEQPSAARAPKPRSVKLSPLRTLRPMPSKGAQRR